jgi:hypothetical protein
MTTQIHDPTSNFNFKNLVLSPPTVITGGNYFIRYAMSGAPLYIQPPKCRTKGGIATSGKRAHTDLLFTNENSEFIQWMENLETHTCNAIYANREKWFETEMELSDVENYFASPMKIYKSGKFYLARANISTRLGKISLKIYNEDEEEQDAETIHENTDVVTILEVQGIKCSARSFQIEMEIKQMMTVSPKELLFETCLLGNKKAMSLSNTDKLPPISPENVSLVAECESVEEEATSNEASVMDESDEINTMDFKSLEVVPILEDFEFELTLDKVTETDTVQIKERNDVYYDKYRDARQKAKVARNLALRAYLEARQIKELYMLDAADSEDSEEERFFENENRSA